MRKWLVLAVVLLLPLATAESGVNESVDTEGTAIVSVDTAGVAPSNDEFGITVVLDDEAASNGTSVQWVTQICINTGVCYPPETSDLTADSGGKSWIGSVLMLDDSSYVNWRVELVWPDGDIQKVPDSGFGWKVWSDCWWDNGTWGGTSTHCQEEEGGLPGFAAPAAAAAIAMAALMARRD